MFGVRLLIHFGLNFLPRLPRIFYTNDLYECYEECFRMIMIGGGLILLASGFVFSFGIFWVLCFAFGSARAALRKIGYILVLEGLCCIVRAK